MNFLKTFLASVLGTFIGLFLLILILTVVLLSSASEPEPYIRSNTILTMELSGTIPAREVQDPFQELLSGGSRRISLPMLKENLEKAAADDRIAGIWITMNRISASWATLETARNYLEEFRRESGKFLYVNTDDLGMNESAYFLASVADSIFFPRETMFEFNGFVIQTSYYKGLLEKIGIDPEIMRAGRYKSAVEPFLRSDSSEENREQLTAILNHVSDTFVSAVESGRGISRTELEQAMNRIPANAVESAYEMRLIDGIAYRDEVEKLIIERLELGEDASLRTVSLPRYNRVARSSAGLSDPRTDHRVAVIHASGMIAPHTFESPFGSDPMITDKGIRNSLEAALENDQVKAIVIHIDSGGGAVSTSELVYEQIRKAAEKKPVIAWLGSVAASGGYYIAMGADQVMASPSTITGSIGVYNMMFDTSKLYNDHLGIYFDTFKTHDHSDLYLMNRPLSDFERGAIQRSVENSYERFLEVVTTSRGISREEADLAGQGRVWTGSDALEQNLVDSLGSLENAIALAAKQAGIEEFRILTYPEPKDLLELFFRSADNTVRNWVSMLLPGSEEVRRIEDIRRYRISQNWAVLPVEFHIE